MKQEVVQNFLDLPGIMGVALMDGRSRPFFCGIDQFLNFQQKEALAQGIRQVIETTPESFTDFKFQFSEAQIYIYKLHRGLILLVLANNDLATEYGSIMVRLKDTLQEDLSNAIATFRLLVGNATLSGQNYWGKTGTNTTSNNNIGAFKGATPKIINPTPLATAAPPLAKPQAAAQPQVASQTSPQDSPATAAPAVTTARRINAATAAQPNPVPVPGVSVKVYLEALNRLSQCAKQYLGTAVIVNYWKASRPNDEWLAAVEIDRSAILTLASSSSALAKQGADPEQVKALRAWVEAFVKRCSVVIRDFPAILDKSDLGDEVRKLLF
ncbi:MAG: hypothetical protein VKK80_10170 [Prochlorothrix sp.]|nr:hypothetical protein [Prochlorothrix sp.]